MVLEAVGNLPEDATWNEISEEIAMLAAIQSGKDDADAGRVLTQDEVESRSATWTSR